MTMSPFQHPPLSSSGEASTLLTSPSLTYSHVETTLRSSLDELHVRSEVSACLHDMLLDVETAHTLQQQLLLKQTQHALQQTETQLRATILESNADRLEREEYRQQLADKLVVELMKTNKVLGELMEWKQTHAYKVDHYDELLARLTQTEEELQAAQFAKYGGSTGGSDLGGPKPPPRTPDDPVKKTYVGATDASMTDAKTTSDRDVIESKPPSAAPPQAAALATLQETGETASAIASPTEKDADAEPDGPNDTEQRVDLISSDYQEGNTNSAPVVSLEEIDQGTNTVTITDEIESAITEETEGDQKIESESMSASATTPAVVMLDDERGKQVENTDDDPPPSLQTVDVEVLMDVFGFLDPMDILNTAQISLSMYNKVDNIFGISEDGQTPPAPTPAPKPISAVAAAQAPTTTTATAVTTAATAPASTDSASASASSSTDTAGPLGKALFSMLQPKPAAASSPSRESARAATAVSSYSKKAPPPLQQSQPLNAKVAQSMASKLSDAELAAIISMTEKVSKAEKEVNLLRNEKEVLMAKLDGTEAVKQFLIGKVRDIEQKLTRSREDEIKVTQQIASDQEVIAFLDSRVQELEQLTDNLTAEKLSTQKELESLKVSTSKKITMLSDMLKYEREKLREDEGDWKATKKVLVKEVKSCRAQILALQAERDGLKGQNDMLRRAVMSTAGAGGGGHKRIGSGNIDKATTAITRERKYT